MKTRSLPVPSVGDISPGAWLALGALLLLVYAVAFDLGVLSTWLTGAFSKSGAFLHELFHDGRHLFGVPCH